MVLHALVLAVRSPLRVLRRFPGLLQPVDNEDSGDNPARARVYPWCPEQIRIFSTVAVAAGFPRGASGAARTRQVRGRPFVGDGSGGVLKTRMPESRAEPGSAGKVREPAAGGPGGHCRSGFGGPGHCRIRVVDGRDVKQDGTSKPVAVRRGGGTNCGRGAGPSQGPDISGRRNPDGVKRSRHFRRTGAKAASPSGNFRGGQGHCALPSSFGPP